MQKLYELVKTNEVLGTVIDAVSQTQSNLIVVEGEKDNHPVRPDDRYNSVLETLIKEQKNITRYYFGSYKTFMEKSHQTKGITWCYAGPMTMYQRAIIIDKRQAFFKIGNEFATSTHQGMIEILKNYLESCASEYKPK